jgi:cytochrome b subunit of formate dehydrogenase
MTEKKFLTILYFLYMIVFAISGFFMCKFAPDTQGGSSVSNNFNLSSVVCFSMLALLIEQVVFHLEIDKPNSKSKPSLDAKTNRNRDNQSE